MANKVDRLLGQMKEHNATDLHLTEAQPPKYRIQGDLVPIPGEPVLTRQMVEDYLSELANPRLWQKFLKEHDYDFAYPIRGYARYRTNYYFHRLGLGAVFRMIPEKVLSFEELGLPNTVLQFVEIGSGLVLVTGPTGSGKTTTLASIINYVNEHYKRHIITLEDPLEFVHNPKQSVITHREINTHTHSFAKALRSAMRLDPDVILVGEMRDTETIGMALTLAEMGIMVFGTLHTNSASKTVDRIVDVFPAEEQSRIRTMLAGSLRGVVAQQLLRRCDQVGRIAAFEILVASPALAALIRAGATAKIESYLQSGGALGMQTMDTHIMQLLQRGVVSGQEAYQKAFDKTSFEQYWQLGEPEPAAAS